MAYGYGNNQNNGRRMTLQERLDAMRKTAIQGHYGFSQDDTPKERLKKRLKALRDGYGTIPQSSWTNRQEQQEQDTTSPSMQFDPQHNEAAPKGAGTTTNRTGAGTGEERRFDPLHNTLAAAGGQDGTSRPGSVTPTTVETTPTSTRQQDNRTLEQRWLDMIADQRREREEAAEAGEARPVQSYTVREDSPLSRIIAEVTGTTPSTAQAEDYQGELDRIATIMPMIDRLERRSALVRSLRISRRSWTRPGRRSLRTSRTWRRPTVRMSCTTTWSTWHGSARTYRTARTWGRCCRTRTQWARTRKRTSSPRTSRI